MWDTSVTTWTGAGDDWIQKVAQQLPRKEDVVIALLKMLRQPTTHLERKRGGIPSNREIWTPWSSSPRRYLMASSWQSVVTARRWSIGSMATRGKKRLLMM